MLHLHCSQGTKGFPVELPNFFLTTKYVPRHQRFKSNFLSIAKQEEATKKKDALGIENQHLSIQEMRFRNREVNAHFSFREAIMRYCNNCGFQVNDDVKVCPVCGAEISQVEEANMTTNFPATGNAPYSGGPNRSNRRKNAVLAAMVAAALVVGAGAGAGAYFLTRGQNAQPAQQTAAQTTAQQIDAKADVKDAASNATTDAKNTKTDAKADAKTDAKNDAKTSAKTDAKTDAQNSQKAQQQAEAQKKAEADAKAKADAAAKAKADAEAKAKADAAAKAKADADAKAKADAEAKAKGDAAAKAKADAEAKAKADAAAKAKADADAKAKAQAEADAKAKADAQAKADAEAKAKAQAEADAKAKADAEAKAKADAEAQQKAQQEQQNNQQNNTDQNTDQTDDASSKNGFQTQDNSLVKNAAVQFCKAWFTNAQVNSDTDSESTPVDNWVNTVASFVDPSSGLYAELTRGKGADLNGAEDICLGTQVTDCDNGVANVTVSVASHDDNPTSGWSTEATKTYKMEVHVNGSGQVSGFTCTNTDADTGQVTTVTH